MKTIIIYLLCTALLLVPTALVLSNNLVFILMGICIFGTLRLSYEVIPHIWDEYYLINRKILKTLQK